MAVSHLELIADVQVAGLASVHFQDVNLADLSHPQIDAAVIANSQGPVSVEGGPIAYSLFNSGKVEPHDLDRFPHLLSAERIEPETDPSAAPFDRDKTVVYLHESHATTTTASFPIRAIMIPRLVGRGDTRIGPVSAARALAALAPSTIVQLHTAGAPALTAMRKLVASVPAFDLALGANVEAAGSVIRDLLAELDLE